MNDFWLGDSRTSGLRRVNVSSWADWVREVIDSKSDKCARISLLSYIAIMCWYIWKSRCEFIFNQQPIFPGRITAAINGAVEDVVASYHVQVTRDPSPVSVLEDATSWSPPCSNFVKINVEASWLRSSGTGFVGVVARDALGGFLAAVRYPIIAYPLTGSTPPIEASNPCV